MLSLVYGLLVVAALIAIQVAWQQAESEGRPYSPFTKLAVLVIYVAVSYWIGDAIGVLNA